nr:hypothetical protein [Candidatus Omnitrophota bacterium]
MSKKHVILCEAGWHNARELSLELDRKNIPVSVLIKGRPEKEARQMISRHKLISNIFIPDKFFAVFVFLYVFSGILFGKELEVFYNKGKTEKMLAGFKKISAKFQLEKIHIKK